MKDKTINTADLKPRDRFMSSNYELINDEIKKIKKEEKKTQ